MTGEAPVSLTHPPAEVRWEKVHYLKSSDQGPPESHTFEYELWLPDFLASWDVWDYWERPRIHSMRRHLKPGMRLWDVGAEVGWLSVVYASMVGPENMVLIEPTAAFWPNIRRTWEHNWEVAPFEVVHALLSNVNSDGAELGVLWGAQLSNADPSVVWPDPSEGDLIERRSYTYIHEHAGQVPQITAGALAESIGPPDALTIDVDGAELLVLWGCRGLFETTRPLVWVSLHPDLMWKDYKTTTGQLFRYMLSFDYEPIVIAVDHETHVAFFPSGTDPALTTVKEY